MDRPNENVELFVALTVEDIEARTLNVSGYGCSPNSGKFD